MGIGCVGFLALTSTASAWTNDLAEVTVSESGGLSERTLRAVETVADVLEVSPTVMQSGTLRMTAVDRGDDPVQSFEPGFAVPMSFVSVDPVSVGPLLGPDLTRAVTSGVVMSRASAGLRGAAVGDTVTLEGWNGSVLRYPITALADDADIGWAELLLADATSAELGVDRPSRVVMWGVNTTVTELLMRSVVPDAPIRVDGPGSSREPFVDGVLPMVSVKERFGEFSFRETPGDRIETDDEWYEANIVTVDLPGLGQFRCHRRVMPAIQGALAEIELLGLSDEIDMADFQLAGGCYNARLARGGDLDRGFAISRHSWGIAIDFNPSTNGFGEAATLSERFGQTFREWGFAWGAGWRVADPMHFEWRSDLTDPTRLACLDRIGEALDAFPAVVCFP